MTAPAGTTAPPDPDTLKVPLTHAQREAMIDYILSKNTEVHNRPFLEATKDKPLIDLYKSLYAVEHHKAPPVTGPNLDPTQIVPDFLTKLWSTLTSANLWLRVLEVGIGVVLLAVGVAHLSGHANPIAKHAGVKL